MISPPRLALALALLCTACGRAPPSTHGDAGAVTSGPTITASTTASVASAPEPPAGPVQAGSLVRSVRGDALLVADEDHRALRVVPLPIDPTAPRREIPMPGAPAQVAAAGDRVLVTVRDPGLLLVLRGDTLEEIGRVPVAADAWGLAVTPDRKTALVTSAWTHRISVVDLASLSIRASLDVTREPRGIAIHPDGKRAYVTHLVGSALTRVDGLDSAPAARSLAFPASPIRAHAGAPDAASLAYAAVLSADGTRLFVPRQALDADGKRPWNGQASVGVLLTARDEPLGVRPARKVRFQSKELDEAVAQGTGRGPFDDVSFTGGIARLTPAFAQPRAVVLRKSTRTLLVASEGTDELVELDALSIEPAGKPLHTYDLGSEREVPAPGRRYAVVLHDRSDNSYDVRLDDGSVAVGYHRVPVQRRLIAGERVSFAPPEAPGQLGVLHDLLVHPGPRAGDTRCGAPSGVALSADEATAFVFCRSNDTLAVVPLERHDGSAPRPDAPLVMVRLGEYPLPPDAALGRRLFHSGRDATLSEGFGCARGAIPRGAPTATSGTRTSMPPTAARRAPEKATRPTSRMPPIKPIQSRCSIPSPARSGRPRPSRIRARLPCSPGGWRRRGLMAGTAALPIW